MYITHTMKSSTRKERIRFDVAADLKARHRICAAFTGYKTRISKLIHHISPATQTCRHALKQPLSAL